MRGGTRKGRPAVALVALALAAAGCGREPEGGADLTLESSVVVRGFLESSVEATGTVEPIRVVEVRTQASGEILRMPVDLGDRVEQGDLLLEIDPRDEVNELEQARADLEQAEAQLRVARSRLERIQALRDSGVVTTEELETAVVNHANARSAHVRAQTRLELAQEQRNDARVEAPISGTIVEKGAEEGQVVTGTRDLTGGTVLLRLADLSNVQVRTLVDESEIGGIRPGQPADITVEAYPQRTFGGRVHQVEPQATVEQNVTMFAVLIRIPNEDGLLRPGMNADVEVVLGRRDDVLKLSNSGVKTPDEARQLVSALGMDPALLERRAAGGEDGEDAGGPEGPGGPGTGVEGADGLPSPERIRTLPPDERRELLRGLDPEDRRRLMARLRDQGGFGGTASGRGGGREAGPAGPRPAFVFVREEGGTLTLEPVRIGLSSWEETEIVAGLAEGDSVVDVPLALVQQSRMLKRFRSRSTVPGMGGGR